LIEIESTFIFQFSADSIPSANNIKIKNTLGREIMKNSFFSLSLGLGKFNWSEIYQCDEK